MPSKVSAGMATGTDETATTIGDNMEYRVCDSCRVVICNDDWSGIEDADVEATIDAFIERVGMLAFSSEDTDTTGEGYWSCSACGYDQIGCGTRLESVG